MSAKTKKSILSFGFLLLLLPVLLLAIKLTLDLRKGATGIPANINIDTKSTQGKIPSTLWQNFAQGGEEPKDMIAPIIRQVRALNPKLIRVDHLFDYYHVYSSPGNYNFSELDKVIDSILATGARPLLSLSYTTPEMATNNQNAGEPKDWNEWKNLIRTTARRYSVEKNISGIYYEVWNEPDLFGGWHYAKSPNYITLYLETARAVAEGAGSSLYKVGGPAITAYYSSWIKSLFAATANSHVRLDFISWHKYSKNIQNYLNDFDDLNKILSDYPQYFDIERLITEVGPNSEPDIWYDNSKSGIHLLSLATQLSGKIHRLFTFELIDGPTSRSDKTDGWGLITHPTKGLKIKPRYYAVQFLNRLDGERLASNGDGSWVTSLSSKNGNTIQTLLVNYDSTGSHTEIAPINYKGLTPGNYQLKTIHFLGNTSTKNIIANSTGTLTENVYLDPNSAIILELSPL